MKKYLIIIVILLLAAGGYIVYDHYFKHEVEKIKILDVETEKAVVNEYFMYGTNFNIKGSLNVIDTNYKDLKLALYNGEFIYKDLNVNIDGDTISFDTGSEINTGLYIDNINRDKYDMFIELTYTNEEDQEKDIKKYYVLDNQTTYKETTYYTMSTFNNKIVIDSVNNYSTMMLNITENTDKEIYDFVIDPGHGGMDSGACSNMHCEIDFTFDMASSLKASLEENGFKVKLTREENDLTKNDIMEAYGTHGRAVISSEVHSKYLFSIHLNSNPVSSVNGVEIYTPANINYDLAKKLSENIVNYTSLAYSNNRTNKMFNGIYTRSFTENDIANSTAEKQADGELPYDITTNANYYYMIRETGGFMTGAYVDNRNEENYNMYYDSNAGCESYILELGYITNSNDVNNIQTKKDDYIKAIVDAIKSNIKH